MNEAPKVEVVTITPQVAERMLATNTTNQRRLRPSAVDRYARDMSRGAWALNGTPITFDNNDRLINGQHRLRACIKSGVSFQTVLVKGVDPASMRTIDTEGIRTTANILEVMGYSNRTAMAAAGRLLYIYERYSRGEMAWAAGAWQVAKTELVEFIEARHTEMEDVAQRIPINTKALKAIMPVTWSLFLATIFSRRDRALMEQFFQQLATGEGLEPDHPMLQLRAQFFIHNSGRDKSTHQTRLMAYTIKTWNWMRMGEPAKRLRWSANEEFPIAR